MVVYCGRCENFIEYDDSDIMMGGDFNAAAGITPGIFNFYIICPECGALIDLGVGVM